MSQEEKHFPTQKVYAAVGGGNSERQMVSMVMVRSVTPTKGGHTTTKWMTGADELVEGNESADGMVLIGEGPVGTTLITMAQNGADLYLYRETGEVKGFTGDPERLEGTVRKAPNQGRADEGQSQSLVFIPADA